MELLSPKTDVVFKMLFSAADNKDILTDFIASVLDIENDDIKELHVVNSEMLPESVEQKYSRLDIAMELRDRKINVEMQVRKLSDFRERVLFYWSKLYAKDLQEGQSYKDLKQTISINILDYNMFDCEACHSVFMLKEMNRDELLTDKCRFDFLELPKADSDSKQIKRLRRWLKFLNLKSLEDAEMITRTDDKVMNKAVFLLKKMSADDKLREIARIRERALHDEASYIADAKTEGWNEGIKKGRAEGIKEGEKKGIKKGRAEGIKKGRAEGIKEGEKKGIKKGRAELFEAFRSMGADEELLRRVQAAYADEE